MNREIEYRGFDGADWIYGSAVIYDESQDAWYMIEHGSVDDDWIMVGRVGQFTGCTDKNGVKIYEGDTVSIMDTFKASIIYDAPSFKLNWMDEWQVKRKALDKTIAWNAHIIYEVVGTIHDKELEAL